MSLSNAVLHDDLHQMIDAVDEHYDEYVHVAFHFIMYRQYLRLSVGSVKPWGSSDKTCRTEAHCYM